MSFLLFMDESGHDGSVPYEVRGGLALPADRVWTFTQQMRSLEKECFGDLLSNHGTELKAVKLLERRRVKLVNSRPLLEDQTRRELTVSFLGQKRNNFVPTIEAHAAYSQSGLLFVEKLLALVKRNRGIVFASIVSRGQARPPKGTPSDFVRKDITFLFERFFYFLEEKAQTGILVLDESDRTDDKRTLNRIERYFERHARGRQHSKLILPTPLFAASDMSYPIQAADIIIYLIGQGARLPGMDEPARSDIDADWIRSVRSLEYRTSRTSPRGEVYRSNSIVYVAEPWKGKV